MNKVYSIVDETEGRKISWQLRCSSVLIILLALSYHMGPSLKRNEPDSPNVLFIHLACFAFHFGAQCWVTFIAGILMFFNLPRVMFGHLQSRMFPAYFVTSLVMASVTLLTYTIRHPYATWTATEQKQGTLLTICVVSTFINSCLLAPGIVQSMVGVFNIEKAHGTGYVVGYADRTQLKKNPDYRKFYIRFRIYHGISGLANLATLVCNTMYLYHLACMCVHLNLTRICEEDLGGDIV